MNITDEMLNHAKSSTRESLSALLDGIGPRSSERLIRACIETASEIAIKHGVRVPFEELLGLDSIKLAATNAAIEFCTEDAVGQAERVLPRVVHALESTEEEATPTEIPSNLSGQARINFARQHGLA